MILTHVTGSQSFIAALALDFRVPKFPQVYASSDLASKSKWCHGRAYKLSLWAVDVGGFCL